MNRIEKLSKALPEGADAALITSDVNRRYFTGLGSSAGTLLAFRDAAYFIIDFRYIEVAKATVTGARVMLQEKLTEQLDTLLKKHGAQTVAIETDYLTVGALEQYRQKLSGYEFLTDSTLNDAILSMRSVKEPQEVACIQKAQAITDAAFLEILDFIKPGKTEKEIAAYLEYCMRRRGADGLAFETIAAGGPNSAKPHAVPGDRPLQTGDFFTLDYGASWGGYCSDMTRTVAVGEPTEEMRRVYQTVLEAQCLGIRTAQAGVSCRAVDAAARELIYKAGYEGCFGHSLGHSVGLEIHEMPGFSPSIDPQTLCREGMVITVEPGVYLEGRFGVRIEDMVWFAPDGTKDLTNSPKELIIL